MQTMYVKSGEAFRVATEAEVAEVAGHYALESFNRERPMLDSPTNAVRALQRVFSGRDYEAFTVLFLTSRHQLIECVEMFRGTIDAASIHPREVVKEVLWRGAANIIIAHNHPSGSSDPSAADIQITHRLVEALALIDVTVVDHLIIGGTGTWSSLRNDGLM
jgi:DNA repair protein RadC